MEKSTATSFSFYWLCVTLLKTSLDTRVTNQCLEGLGQDNTNTTLAKYLNEEARICKKKKMVFENVLQAGFGYLCKQLWFKVG